MRQQTRHGRSDTTTNPFDRNRLHLNLRPVYQPNSTNSRSRSSSIGERIQYSCHSTYPSPSPLSGIRYIDDIPSFTFESDNRYAKNASEYKPPASVISGLHYETNKVVRHELIGDIATSHMYQPHAPTNHNHHGYWKPEMNEITKTTYQSTYTNGSSRNGSGNQAEVSYTHAMDADIHMHNHYGGVIPRSYTYADSARQPQISASSSNTSFNYDPGGPTDPRQHYRLPAYARDNNRRTASNYPQPFLNQWCSDMVPLLNGRVDPYMLYHGQISTWDRFCERQRRFYERERQARIRRARSNETWLPANRLAQYNNYETFLEKQKLLHESIQTRPPENNYQIPYDQQNGHNSRSRIQLPYNSAAHTGSLPRHSKFEQQQHVSRFRKTSLNNRNTLDPHDIAFTDTAPQPRLTITPPTPKPRHFMTRQQKIDFSAHSTMGETGSAKHTTSINPSSNSHYQLANNGHHPRVNHTRSYPSTIVPGGGANGMHRPRIKYESPPWIYLLPDKVNPYQKELKSGDSGCESDFNQNYSSYARKMSCDHSSCEDVPEEEQMTKSDKKLYEKLEKMTIYDPDGIKETVL